jgi:(p)ppGpp synthase/HD superfamily hydrolase
MVTLIYMGADDVVKVAGLLHDVVEDTDYTIDDIRDVFGIAVEALVEFCTDDKSKNWTERKTHTIDKLNSGDCRLEELQVAFADKYANMRTLQEHYGKIGDKVWERFNKGKEPQAWYYGELLKAFKGVDWFYKKYASLVDDYEGMYKAVFQ